MREGGREEDREWRRKREGGREGVRRGKGEQRGKNYCLHTHVHSTRNLSSYADARAGLN